MPRSGRLAAGLLWVAVQSAGAASAAGADDRTPLGDMANPAPAELVERTRNPSPKERRHAAQALAKLDPSSTVALDILIRLLDDPSGEVRHSVAYTMTTLGPAIRPALPALLQALRTEHRKPGQWYDMPGDPVPVQWHYVLAMKAAGPESVSYFIAALDDRNLAVRYAAIDGITAFPPTPEGIAALTAAARRGSVRAAQALARQGTVDDLVRAANGVLLDMDRLRVLLGIYPALGPKGRDALRALVRDRREDVRKVAAHSLKSAK